MDEELACWVCSLGGPTPHFSHRPLTSPRTRPPLQTELSLQKEQLQLKIIELEDEADKWQKEKDRIKVSGPAPLPSPSSGGRAQAHSDPHTGFLPLLPLALAFLPIPLLSRGQEYSSPDTHTTSSRTDRL